MKIIKAYFVLMLFVLTIAAQAQVINDTIQSNIAIRFNKIENSESWACYAELQASYVPKNQIIVMCIKVPNHDVRYKTTKSDFVIAQLNDKEKRFDNVLESEANGLIQKFVFSISKIEFSELLLNGFKKMTFNFAPNQEFIKKSLELEKGLDIKCAAYIIEKGSQTVKTTISKPDKKQLEDLKSWAAKL